MDLILKIFMWVNVCMSEYSLELHMPQIFIIVSDLLLCISLLFLVIIIWIK